MPSNYSTTPTKERVDLRRRMYIVLAICCAVLMLTSLFCFFLLRSKDSTDSSRMPNQQVVSPGTSDSQAVIESNYNKDENTIDAERYSGTILTETADAGLDYVHETLFLGDSNTARMYRQFGEITGCSLDNAIGSVGMAARSLANYACVKFAGYSNYVTMPQAVALMQPKRVIITFGTNDLDGSTGAERFIEVYTKGIEAVQNAYPSVDIIINSIPPLGKQHSNQSLTQSQVDAYNQAIVQMCEDHGWKYLNSAEVLKDNNTGYAKDGYVVSDGIHLTEAAMQALFQYVRTHSYITDDDRPALTNVPRHVEDLDVTVISYTPQPAAPTQAPQQNEQKEPEYTYWTETVEPTCTEEGYTIYHCNEDSNKDYTGDYVAALGHNTTTNPDGSVVCTRCGEILQAAAAPTEAPQTTEPTPVPEQPTEEPSVTPPQDGPSVDIPVDGDPQPTDPGDGITIG